ncbi:Pre-mRNA-processing protein 45 [Smittium mucronatum]|uniref:Pre-mRNA-processing protein 45 n=1 Tax=Smittium mucronatum TaxID=133383 RepID=A0A1R0GNV7_9FUNG|nr:Pre-mRNA-processing protein 45 [Smittium mucronatum]OLY78583.1 Pre-mRNA-processing protein 45 [Smittium mucronatum]
MSTLSQLLPKPKFSSDSIESQNKVSHQSGKNPNTLSLTRKNEIPPYGKRSGWTPKTQEDFGDGGAYPEILIGQYPLRMGLKKQKKGQVLSKQVDSDGNVRYDAIARYGHGEDRVIQTDFKELIPLAQRIGTAGEKLIQDRPDEELVMETAQRTREALEKKIDGKLTASKPRGQSKSMESGSSYIRYTPNKDGPGYDPKMSQRIIRMSEMQIDPMEPPKFKHKRVPNAPPSPPAPVLHSPPRHVSVEEQKAWIIPPCISNWKNAKGYTIPLDKRLAADGRGLQDVKISDNFAKLSEALLAAERHARDEVRQRSLMQQNLVRKEKESKEEHLRLLAHRAREERSGVISGAKSSASHNQTLPPRKESKYDSNSETEVEDSAVNNNQNSHDDERAFKREEIRRDKQRELRRDLRMSKMGAEAKAKYIAKMENRDISEKIALGLAKPSSISESQFDSRLLHMNESSIADLNDDEGYNIYDKALLKGSNANFNYRPHSEIQDDSEIAESVSKSMENDRFGIKSGQESSSRNGDKSSKASNIRSNPVEFEKDVFGVDQFLNDTKLGLKRQREN